MTRRGVFVTGTGTGVGKTFVSCALARRARHRGARRVFGFKPIETGCVERDGRLIGADQELLCEAAGDWQRGSERGAYQFAPAVAPQVAAEQAGSRIDLARVREIVAAQDAELAIVEGAGGWRVPITADADMSTLAGMIGFPVVIVGHATLGTINHTLLTIEAVERDGQEIAAVVLSRRPAEDVEHALDNSRRISARWPGLITLMSEPDDLDVVLSRCFT